MLNNRVILFKKNFAGEGKLFQFEIIGNSKSKIEEEETDDDEDEDDVLRN